MLNPITPKKKMSDTYQYELTEQLTPDNYHILDELPVGVILLYKGQVYTKDKNNTFKSLTRSYVTFPEIIEYNFSKAGLECIEKDINTDTPEEELEAYLDIVSKYLDDTEKETRALLAEVCDANGGVLKGPKFDYIEGDDGDIVPRVNVKYARPFPILDFIIKDGVPYIVIDRDEVYDISHLIAIYNEQFGD